MEKHVKSRPHAQGARWRRLDNTAKLFVAVAGEDLSNVFRISITLKEEVKPELLQTALQETLTEFDSFRVKLRKGFFWNYFETNNREPLIEEESTYPCKYIDPHNSSLYLFRVSYYKKRINLEVFHALTDGMGAANFLKRLTERYLELSLCMEKCPGAASGEAAGPIEANAPVEYQSPLTAGEDGYLKHYKKQPHHHYGTEQAMSIEGEYLPLDAQNIVHGYMDLEAVKALCRKEQVSITKYLTALLIWSLIQVYSDEETLKKKVGVNLPINLRSFFDSGTMANFFAVTNIFWEAGRKPESFEILLAEVSRQMDEKIVKDKLEEIISYNVSNEKKWYVRIAPLFIKNMVMNTIFLRSSRAYTMTLSNLGPMKLAPEFEEMAEDFQVIIGVSKRQKMKCGVAAFKGRLSISFNSVFQDTRLLCYFFNFLKEKGIEAELESNGVADQFHDRGTYPRIPYDKRLIRKLVNIFYLVLFTAAIMTGVVNLATYSIVGTWWSSVTIGCIAYVAITVRYSVMRRASLAGILVRESVGAQILLVIIDWMTGFHGWSFNYAIPSVVLFDVIAVVCLILINRLNWQSYFMYQIAITIFSFIPMILWAAGWITRPLMSVITVLLSTSVLITTIVLGDRSVKKELRRRFHL